MILDQEQIDNRLAKLDKDWFQSGDGQLTVSYEFDSFKDARKFVDLLAAAAEKLDHHPSISWKYTTVIVSIITHEADALTDKDFDLAKEAQDCYKRV